MLEEVGTIVVNVLTYSHIGSIEPTWRHPGRNDHRVAPTVS